jgi:hypothetical protein
VIPKTTLLLASALLCGSLAHAQSAPSPPCGEEPSETLLVFVGRQLNLKPVSNEAPPGYVILDSKYLARYQILHVLCGLFPSDTIEFEVYDHYGTPAFAQFETVLLYVSRYNGRMIHQKYMYNPVYETIDGDWAGCGDPYELDEVHRGQVRAAHVRFKTEVSFPIANLTEAQIKERYPSEYFVRRGNRVVCTAGARIQDLFAIKRDGFLRARGLFK